MEKLWILPLCILHHRILMVDDGVEGLRCAEVQLRLVHIVTASIASVDLAGKLAINDGAMHIAALITCRRQKPTCFVSWAVTQESPTSPECKYLR